MKKAMNQSLMTWILNGVSILALVFIVLDLFSYGHVSDELEKANEERFSLTYNANRFMNGSAYLTNEVRAFAATGEQEHYDNYWNEVDYLKNRDLGVAAMQEIGITQEEQAMIDAMSALSNELVPMEDAAMQHVHNGDAKAALAYVYGVDYSASIAKINSLKEEFLDMLDARTLAKVEELGRKGEYMRMAMCGALALAGLMQLLSLILIRRKVLRPLIKVRDQMGEISRGNLSAAFALEPDTSELGMLVNAIHETKRELKKYIEDIGSKMGQMAQGKMDLSIGDDYRGEFRPIQDAMRQILDSLNGALSQITATSGQVSAESERMASGAQVLSDGAVRQASAVQELSASIQEISVQVNRTSEDADNARTSSLGAMAQLEICNKKMAEMTVAMENISKASHQIGGIIKTIEDISFQTNILALNAAVEAARAGEAGKGFAVVADEVQSLANKSSISANDITELIQNSMKLVQHGTTLSKDTTQALAAMVTGAENATNLIGSIAESATQQAQSIKQVTLGMEQISEVVQTNAATAEESAASAQELHSQAEEMRISVQKFRLRRR